jgi:hypothetical protein
MAGAFDRGGLVADLIVLNSWLIWEVLMSVRAFDMESRIWKIVVLGEYADRELSASSTSCPRQASLSPMKKTQQS